MKSIQIGGGALLLATCVVGCSDIKVESAWTARSAAIPIGSSFSWMPDQSLTPGTSGAVNPQLQELIHGMVESGFVAKGYEKKESDPADFWIGCRIARDNQGDKYSSIAAEQYAEGTLVIYVVDPKSRERLWKAWAQARLNDANSPEAKRQRFQQAVDQMLKNFPARGKPASTAKK